MCGLVTILAPEPRTGLSDLAARMLGLVAHRGPDGEGMVALAASKAGLVEVGTGRPASLVLAHRRLAIQDTSDAGLQPMRSADGSCLLSYNGEVYNFRDLRRGLERAGTPFRSGCDTEVLLELLAREGRACLPRLDGMFALCLADTRSKRLLLVRDRFGIKPLYLWPAPTGELCIASEIKAFTAHPGWRARVNTPRAIDFLNRGVIDHVPGQTMFDGVRPVRPGTWIELALDGAHQLGSGAWFDLGAASPEPGASLGELLDASVRRRLVADVPVGSCLSGGIDSSSIVALATRALRQTGAGRGQFHAIHARAETPGIDESAMARAAAAHAGAELHEITPSGPDLFDRLDELVWAQDEPFGSPSIFAQFRVFEEARRLGLKVMLDGQGADEQLCGYHAFFKAALAEHLSRLRLREAHVHAHAVRRLHRVGLAAQLALAVGAFVPARVRALARDGSRLVATRGPGDPFDSLPHGWRTVRGFSLDQLMFASLPMLLHWEDRNSMWFGVEARVPFLGHEVVAASLALPTREKIRRGVTKWALRNAMRGLVPDAVLDRTDKIAFATPERAWVTGDARAPRLLGRGLDAAAGWIDDHARRRVLDAAGRRPPTTPRRADDDNAVWRLICFGAWVDRFGVETARG